MQALPWRRATAPHILRGIELYKGGIIFYSLGNFLFENDTTTHQPADFYEKCHMSNTSMAGEGMDNRSRERHHRPGREPGRHGVLLSLQWAVEGGQATALRLCPIHLGMGASQVPERPAGLCGG